MNWQRNDPIIDPDGRAARLITLPIPGRAPANAVIQYDDDNHGRVIDLARCRRPDDPAEQGES